MTEDNHDMIYRTIGKVMEEVNVALGHHLKLITEIEARLGRLEAFLVLEDDRKLARCGDLTERPGDYLNDE